MDKSIIGDVDGVDLDDIDDEARAIGAVNTIKITKKGKLVGYNTDYYGFKKTIDKKKYAYYI